MMLSLLKQAVEEGILRYLDIHLAQRFVGQQSPLALLAVSWLSYEASVGHVCLPLSLLTEEQLFHGRHPQLADEIWQLLGQPTIEDWRRSLLQCDAVSDGSQTTPFVLDLDRLYLQRLWCDEQVVAEFFAQLPMTPERNLLTGNDEAQLCTILSELFPDKGGVQPDWQKVAAAVAITRRIAIIFGGPGTGKTTTVARILAVLLKIEQRNWRIALATPTGKAAARLTDSLSSEVKKLPLTNEQRQMMPQEALTLHRLLGNQPNSSRFRYHAENPLDIDLLVIDEASMVDLPMMAAVIQALPQHGRLILLGDHKQLASVEAGAVFGDICRFSEQGYSPERALQLSRLTGYSLPSRALSPAVPIRDNLCLLTESHRFNINSGIGQLAQAINRQDLSAINECLRAEYDDLILYPVKDETNFQQLIKTCLEIYQPYLQAAKKGNAEIALEQFATFRLLCALRHGPFGVSGLNEKIEQGLKELGNIYRYGQQAWYVGRPIMITRNDSVLGLYNGDIGVTLMDPDGALRVFFRLADGTIRSVPPNRLPHCETAFAMTVHKSQGSEFEHVLFVLPDNYSPILTRELVYTAITRARKKLTLFVRPTIFTMAINKATSRYSGLAERLKRQQQ